MKVAVTGGTGFIGRRIITQLLEAGHGVRAWYRPSSDRGGSNRAGLPDSVEWVPGELGNRESVEALLSGCDALVHSALFLPSGTFQGGEGDVVEFLDRNFIGGIQLFEAAHRLNVSRTIFISTCAVHDVILADRKLDESHPLWPKSHYGAHKAALEKFVHSFGIGRGMKIAALRPTGVYGEDHDVSSSKWFELVRSVKEGKTVRCERGGKEVHVDDVARAAILMLESDDVAWGTAYNCYDRYISDFEVAELARELSGSTALLEGARTAPKNEIDTTKIRGLGMEFGGTDRLRSVVAALVQSA